MKVFVFAVLISVVACSDYKTPVTTYYESEIKKDDYPLEKSYGGDYEKMKYGGEYDQKNYGGDYEKMKYGGDYEKKNYGGDYEKMKYGGDYEKKNYGGDYEKMKYGGDYEKKNYGGDYEKMKYGGDYEKKNYDAGYGMNKGYDKEYAPVPYNYYYAVKDDYTYADYSAQQESDGKGYVTGSYKVELPDGRTQIVYYKADSYNGYTAEVKYEGEAYYPEYKDKPYTANYNQDYAPYQNKKESYVKAY